MVGIRMKAETSSFALADTPSCVHFLEFIFLLKYRDKCAEKIATGYFAKGWMFSCGAVCISSDSSNYKYSTVKLSFQFNFNDIFKSQECPIIS